MLFLVLAAIFFAGIHLGVAGTTWRDRAVAVLGEGAYRAVFSIASLAGIIWLVMSYRHAPYVTTWGIPVWWKPVAIMLMLPAFLLAVTGLTTSNPTIVGEEGRVARPPEGIVRVTRHPFLIGVGLWAVVHLIANGDLASFIFFGSLAVTALAGPCRSTPSAAAHWAPLGSPSRPKPPSFRSRRLLRAEHGSNRMRSRHGNGSPPSSPTACF